jgi:hypothetical protein
MNSADMNFSDQQELQGYASVADYLNDYLALLSMKLHREVILVRAQRGEDRQESFLGLFISESDVDAILAELHGQLLDALPGEELLLSRIERIEAAINLRIDATSIVLPIMKLARLFGLQAQESELLMLSLAPEIDERFGRVFGFLHDDVGRKSLSISLASKLSPSADKMITEYRRALNADAPLLRFSLLKLKDDDSMPISQRGIKLDNRIVNFLLGVWQIDEQLLPILGKPWSGKVSLEEDACTQSADELSAMWQQQDLPLLIHEPPQADRDVWLMLFCAAADLGLLTISWQRLTLLEAGQAQRVLTSAVREAHLGNSLLHVCGVDGQAPLLFAHLNTLMTSLVCVSIADGIHRAQFTISPYEVTVPELSVTNRVACWRGALPEQVTLSAAQLFSFADRYPLPVREIDDLCRAVTLSANNTSAVLTLENLCRARVGHHMCDIAQLVSARFSFSDLVLPASTQHSLREIIARRANAQQVLYQWRVADLFNQADGSSVLFIGPSGTGKTMTASVIANSLGLNMFRVDLSGVVSKYIGETEKNLEKIFAAAALSEVVLFIDEADALFGKRSEVKDAHDRYANIETSYLLQKMEDHRGLVILASNFAQNIDDAFFRRFSSVVEFSLPNQQDRLCLWGKLQQLQAPLDDNIDLEFLAERFDISGGHIKNCIVAAAFQAAEQQQPISMQMLIRAVSREYAKIGKPISRNHFGDYYTALRREAAGDRRE